MSVLPAFILWHGTLHSRRMAVWLAVVLHLLPFANSDTSQLALINSAGLPMAHHVKVVLARKEIVQPVLLKPELHDVVLPTHLWQVHDRHDDGPKARRWKAVLPNVVSVPLFWDLGLPTEEAAIGRTSTSQLSTAACRLERLACRLVFHVPFRKHLDVPALTSFTYFRSHGFSVLLVHWNSACNVLFTVCAVQLPHK